MLATLQKSMLDWLQLKPELLSGTPANALSRPEPADAPAPAAAAPKPVPEPAPDLHTGLISAATVLPPTGLSFYHPAPPAQAAEPVEPWRQVLGQAYPAPGTVYNPIEAGGNQRAALAEMAGYLSTRLMPNPPKLQQR